MDCDSGYLAAKPARVTKPKIFDDKPIFVRVEPGVRERIDLLKGAKRQGDYVRELLMEALEGREQAAELKRREKP